MGVRMYRVTVLCAVVSSFLVGMHVPALHVIIEHGEPPRGDVLIVTMLLALVGAICAWKLLRLRPPV